MLRDSNGNPYRDALFVLVLTLWPAASYVFGLGFYSDDWLFLQSYQEAGNQNWHGYFSATFEPSTRGRPLQIAYQSLLFTLMGANPLGLHLVNTFVLGVGAVFLYLLLSEVTNRQISISVTVIYATMAHYSTVRFWFAANQVALSALLCFVSGWFLVRYSHLACERGRRGTTIAMLLLAVTTMILSSLAYETHAFLFLIFMGIAAWNIRSRSEGHRRRWYGGAASYLALLAATYVWKQLASTRGVEVDSLVGRTVWFGRNVVLAAIKDFIDLGAALPLLLARKAALGEIHLDNALVALCAAVACYLYFRSTGHLFLKGERRTGLLLVGMGLAVTFFVRMIFFVSHGWIVTNLGIQNRVDMAAALGVAVVFAGVLVLASGRLTRRWASAGSSLVASVVFVQLLTVGLAGDAWGRSWRTQNKILDDLRGDVPTLDDGSIVILDACRAEGPAPIFESFWAFTGALQLSYDARELRGSVLNDESRMTADRLVIPIYGWDHEYPYSATSWVYQWPSRRLVLMDSREALEGTENDRADCPPARAGHGSPTLDGLLDYLFRYKFG